MTLELEDGAVGGERAKGYHIDKKAAHIIHRLVIRFPLAVSI
jgi:hypothetical protein